MTRTPIWFVMWALAGQPEVYVLGRDWTPITSKHNNNPQFHW